MRRVLCFIVFVICSYSLFSQDEQIKIIQQLTLENHLLKSDSLKPLHDSIFRLNRMYRVEVSDLKEMVNDLKNDTSELRKKITRLDRNIENLNKNKIKIERDLLLLKMDSMKMEVEKLNLLVKSQYDTMLLNKAKDKEKIEMAKMEVKEQLLINLASTYTNKSFDSVIQFSTKESVFRDMKLLGDRLDCMQVLNDLALYFETDDLFRNKYDNKRSSELLLKLKNIKRESVLLKSMINKLSDYKLLSTGLKDCMYNILEYDDRESKKYLVTKGLEEAEKELKRALIFKEIKSYIVSYGFNFIDYPYLTSIITDIIFYKQSDPDRDIKELYTKL